VSGAQPISFDKDTFMANFRGMEDLAYEAIASLLSALPSLISRVDEAIRLKNASELELAAHTLKGAISNFYAEPSEHLASKLEQIGHAQRTAGADRVHLEMKIELEGLRYALESLLNERKSA
jgi:HPt (histidine-containing phosphotransfer) domain-containing protein